MGSKKVSVIVPIYNAEKYIDRCIQSVLNQDYDWVELILINDGSRDGSGEICEEYASKNENIVYKYQENAGVSAARNAGINLASGEYIVFVDSDDSIKSNMLSMLVEALERTNADLCICGYDAICSTGTTTVKAEQAEVSGKEKLAEYFAMHFCEAIASSVWCKLFKKSLIIQDFNTDLSMGEDLLFSLEYIKHINKIAVISEALYNYDKTNESSITRDYKTDYYEQNLYVFNQWREWIHESEYVNDRNIHLRIVRAFLRYIFTISSGKIDREKILLLKSVIDDELIDSINKTKANFHIYNRITLNLVIHRRCHTVLLFCNTYCKIKESGFIAQLKSTMKSR